MKKTHQRSGESETTGHVREPDVYLVTSSGRRFQAHCCVLASASPVLESLIDRPRKYPNSDKTISILGVPCDAVSAFVDFLYYAKCGEEQMEKYGMHLLALSHVYMVRELKQRCTKWLAKRLTIEDVVDVLQLSRLYDAPDLYLKCMRLLTRNFKAVELTEGWNFIQRHDPWLELEILQFMDETEARKKRTRKQKEDQSLYFQLSEAMECLEHICTEGCTNVGPYDAKPTKKAGPCSKFATCHGLQILIKHFATCEKRVRGGCHRCKRMWQLLRLHSSICEQTEMCKVPLCRQFKLKVQQVKKGNDVRWRLLVRRVIYAKVMLSLSMSLRKREGEPRMNLKQATVRTFKLDF